MRLHLSHCLRWGAGNNCNFFLSTKVKLQTCVGRGGEQRSSLSLRELNYGSDRDDTKLPHDGGETPKSQEGRGWRLDDRV